jgi:hypothetical protein
MDPLADHYTMGEPVKAVHDHIFLDNGLNTLTIPTGKMYDDYVESEKPLIRFGSSAAPRIIRSPACRSSSIHVQEWRPSPLRGIRTETAPNTS